MVTIKVYNGSDKLAYEFVPTKEEMYNSKRKRKNSILDILLNKEINVYVGCMGGSCCACVCELVSGKEHLDIEGCGTQIYKGIPESSFLTCIATIKEDLKDDAVIEIKKAYD